MFKIKSIILNDSDCVHFSEEDTLVYGPNNTGKSILFKILYFMLGSEKGFEGNSVWELQGLDNVHTISMIIENGGLVYFMRNKGNENYYKYSNDDEYMMVDLNVYREKIQAMLIESNECFDFYKEVVEENLSYRGFSYLNFIDQYAIGNVINLFPNDYRYIRRIRKQMQFLFDSSKLLELSRLERERAELIIQIEQLNNHMVKRNVITTEIYSHMEYLNIEKSDLMADNKKRFLEYIDTNKEKVCDPINKELNYLLNVSNQLNNQIQIEKTFSKQRDLIGSRNKKNSLLLQLLKNTIGADENYLHYYQSIEKLLNDIKTQTDIFSMKDYSLSIEKIISKKKQVDFLIANIKNTMSDKSEIKVNNSINQLKFLFEEFEKIKISSEYDVLLAQKKNLDKEIKEKRITISASQSNELNRFITESYLNMNKNLSFVSEDYNRHNFLLEFIPSKMQTIGKETETYLVEGSAIERIVEFVPGSKARLTCWQIITYIGVHLYIRKNFSSLPLLPIIVVDGINEPFDDKFSFAYEHLSKLCNDNGIQLIVMSTERAGNHIFDISSGLNSNHNK